MSGCDIGPRELALHKTMAAIHGAACAASIAAAAVRVALEVQAAALAVFVGLGHGRSYRQKHRMTINAKFDYMKLVIDSNCLQSDELRTFLQKSNNNFAVLTDFAAMEAYKEDTLTVIYKSMEIVSKYPKQVLILKGSAKVCGMNGKPKGLQRRLIDDAETKDFPRYIKALARGRNGDLRIQQGLRSRRLYSQAHFDKMLNDATDMKPVFDTLAKLYSKEERKIIRDSQPYTSGMIEKLGTTLIEMSGSIFRSSPLVRRIPTFEELPNTFLFRAALCCYLMAIRRGALGGLSDAKPERLRNDMVDMAFVAYGTYFDGILSKDRNVNRMYQDACIMLAGLFNAEVPSLAGF